MKHHENTHSNFLSFALIAQQFITVAFAIYAFFQQQILLTILFIAVASILCVALSAFHILKHFRLARLLLISTLVSGYFFLLVIPSKPTSLIWCLTVLPVLAGTLGHRQSAILLVIIFTVSIWLLLNDAVPFVTRQYDSSIIMYFLSSYTILAMFSLTMGSSFFNRLKSYDTLSSKAYDATHRDILTDLPNRQHMEECLKIKNQQYRLGDQSFSLALIDIDNFKNINDRYGRDIGDKILQSIAELIKKELREGDLIARWSGKQFILLLPNVSLKVATKVAERLRKKISQLTIESQGDQLNLTLSMGIACITQSNGLDDLLSCAENAVYQAKHMGRNMVVAN